MSDESSQDNNPYASPAGTGIEGSDGRIYPTKAPADLLDILIFPIPVLVSAVLLIGPSFCLMIALLSFSPGVPWLRTAAILVMDIGIIAMFCWTIWVVFRTIQSLLIDEEGLHFARAFQSPEDWPWNEILHIRPATRREVVWHGRLRPLFNPRERAGISTLGHYRIQGKNDYCFFPPKNAQAFVEAIARYRPDLLTTEA